MDLSYQNVLTVGRANSLTRPADFPVKDLPRSPFPPFTTLTQSHTSLFERNQHSHLSLSPCCFQILLATPSLHQQPDISGWDGNLLHESLPCTKFFNNSLLSTSWNCKLLSIKHAKVLVWSCLSVSPQQQCPSVHPYIVYPSNFISLCDKHPVIYQNSYPFLTTQLQLKRH